MPCTRPMSTSTCRAGHQSTSGRCWSNTQTLSCKTRSSSAPTIRRFNPTAGSGILKPSISKRKCVGRSYWKTLESFSSCSPPSPRQLLLKTRVEFEPGVTAKGVFLNTPHGSVGIVQVLPTDQTTGAFLNAPNSRVGYPASLVTPAPLVPAFHWPSIPQDVMMTNTVDSQALPSSSPGDVK